MLFKKWSLRYIWSFSLWYLLVKIEADVKNENELLLASRFSFLCGCYIYIEYFDFYLKIKAEIELLIKIYDTKMFDKYLHFKKTWEREVQMVGTWFNDLHRWSEI